MVSTSPAEADLTIDSPACVSPDWSTSPVLDRKGSLKRKRSGRSA